MAGTTEVRHRTPRRPSWRLWLFALGVLATLPLLFAATSRERLLALNTLYLAGATCALALPLGTALAVLIARTDILGRRVVWFTFAALLFLPLYLQTAAWDAGFGRQGWYSNVFASIDAPPLAGWRGAIWVHAMAAIPWTTWIVAIGLRRVAPEVEEAALLDASPFQVLRFITLPHAVDSIGLAALWIFITTAAEMTVTDMYQVNTYARELYIGFALGEFLVGGSAEKAGVASFGVWPGVAITAWLTIAAASLFAALTRWDALTALRPTRAIRLGSARLVSGCFAAATVLLVAGIPLASLVYQAGIYVRQEDGHRTRIWSAAKFFAVLAESPGRFEREIGWTLLIGGVTATLAMGIGAVLAWLARRGGWRAAPALSLAAAGVAIPGPIIGLALIAVLNRREVPWLVWLYDRSIFAPTAAMLLRTLPWAILPCWFAFRSIPREILESGELDGAAPVTRLMRLAVPLRWPALALAWLISLAVATGDLAASILVVPPGVDMLSVRIFGLIHAGVDDHVAGICLLTTFSIVALATGGWFFAKRFGSSYFKRFP